MPNQGNLRSPIGPIRAALGGVFGHLGGLLWTQTMGRAVRRALPLPPGVRVLAVGGATLGGSGKTPLAIACAEQLAAMGARVTIVGHAYRAKPGSARVVSPGDRLEEVGDEALLAARVFAREGAGAPGPRPRVVVAPQRAEAMAWAAPNADVLILDGVAQTAPAPASLALLALDGAHPWGRAQALPPRGDLRASVGALVDACDALVPIHDGRATAQADSHLARSTAHAASITEDPWDHPEVDGLEPMLGTRLPGEGREVFAARAESHGAWDANGALQTWESLRSVRVGLLTALARPERVMATLARRGIRPHVVFIGRDHGPIPAGAAVHEREPHGSRIDVWLATAKCALHAERARLALPLATLDYSVVLPARLCVRLRALAVP